MTTPCNHAAGKFCSNCYFEYARSTMCEHDKALNTCLSCYMPLLDEACATDREMAAAAALAKEQSLRRSARLAAKPRVSYEEAELDEEREAREAADIEKEVERAAKDQALMAKAQERAAKAEQKRAEKEIVEEAKRKARAESYKAVAAAREAALKAAKEAVKNAWRQARAAEKEAVAAALKAAKENATNA